MPLWALLSHAIIHLHPPHTHTQAHLKMTDNVIFFPSVPGLGFHQKMVHSLLILWMECSPVVLIQLIPPPRCFPSLRRAVAPAQARSWPACTVYYPKSTGGNTTLEYFISFVAQLLYNMCIERNARLCFYSSASLCYFRGSNLTPSPLLSPILRPV